MRLIFLLISFLSLSAAAQPTFKAELSRNLLGEFYTIQYTVEGAAKVSAFTPPDLRALNVLRGVEQTQGYSLVNGELQPYVTFIYQVTPRKSGRVHIGDAVVVVDGKALKSGPLEIFSPGKSMAVDAPPSELDGYVLRDGERAQDKLRGNLFVRLNLSRTRCYVGEPVIAEYKLYTRLNSESRVVKRPSFNGFSVFDMVPQESGAVQRETINGRVFDVYPLRKVMMYPLQSGSLELEPLEIENQVSFVRPEALGGGSLADALRAYGEGKAPAGSVVKERVVVSNPAQTVQVMALPDAGKPANFSGAVGRFSVTAKVDQAKVEQGAVAYLDVTVSGQGNLPVIGKPTIAWPEGVETFEDSIREDYDQFRSAENWRKTFTVPFTARHIGETVIPSIRLVYFNPDSGRYSTASSEPIRLAVTPATNAVKPEDVKRSFWDVQKDRTWLLLPVVLILGMIILFIVQRLREARRARALEAEALAAAERAREQEWAMAQEQRPRVPLVLDQVREAAQAGDAMAFYKAEEEALRRWCRDNLGILPGAGREERSKAWLASGRPMELLEEWTILHRHAESARFDPLLGSEGLGDALARLEDFAAKLDPRADQSVNL